MQTVISELDRIHAAAIGTVMHLIIEFSARSFSPSELAQPARPQLESFGSEILGMLPSAGFNEIANRVRQEYTAVFGERLDGALRDIEVGLIGGRNVAPAKDADLRATILKRFYDERHIRSFTRLPVPADASIEDRIVAANICSQLAESGLIEWKTPVAGTPEGMGCITARGIDVIEGTAAPPIAISIGSVTVQHSRNIQIGTAGDASIVTRRVDIGATAQEIKDLIEKIDQHRSSLPPAVQEKLPPILDELRAASAEEKLSPSRLTRGLEQLKNVMEIAAGDLVAAGVLHLLPDLLLALSSH